MYVPMVVKGNSFDTALSRNMLQSPSVYIVPIDKVNNVFSYSSLLLTNSYLYDAAVCNEELTEQCDSKNNWFELCTKYKPTRCDSAVNSTHIYIYIYINAIYIVEGDESDIALGGEDQAFLEGDTNDVNCPKIIDICN